MRTAPTRSSKDKNEQEPESKKVWKKEKKSCAQKRIWAKVQAQSKTSFHPIVIIIRRHCAFPTLFVKFFPGRCPCKTP